MYNPMTLRGWAFVAAPLVIDIKVKSTTRHNAVGQDLFSDVVRRSRGRRIGDLDGAKTPGHMRSATTIINIDVLASQNLPPHLCGRARHLESFVAMLKGLVRHVSKHGVVEDTLKSIERK